jgi:hypothetical protein
MVPSLRPTPSTPRQPALLLQQRSAGFEGEALRLGMRPQACARIEQSTGGSTIAASRCLAVVPAHYGVSCKRNIGDHRERLTCEQLAIPWSR